MELDVDYIKKDEVASSGAPDMPSLANVTEVDANGDLILEVGEQSLLVSSKVLSVASPVFRTMLGPNFKEGQSLVQRKPVCLKEDNAEAITTLCQILHFHSEQPSPAEFGSAASLIMLAKLADKYDCLEAICPATSIWLTALTQPLETTTRLEELFPLLEAAYLLDDAQAYQRITKQILLHDEGQVFEKVQSWAAADVIPLKTFCELHKRRQSILENIELGMQQIIVPIINKQGYEPTTTVQNRVYGALNHTYHKFNIHDCIVVSAFLRELRRIDLWGSNLSGRSISYCCERFHDFDQCEPSQRLGFATFPRQNGCPACVLDTQSRMATLYNNVVGSCSGLCLDCLYKGQFPDQERECRVKH